MIITFNRKLTIVSHNVLRWKHPRKVELGNTYRTINADVILLQSHCITTHKVLKIAGYIVYKRNRRDEGNDGVAIAIKHDIPHKIIDDFHDELMAITVNTATGPITFGTCYFPPRRNYLPSMDLLRLTRRHHPVYVLGDCNAHHPAFGYNYYNVVGVALERLIQQSQLQLLGPSFTTFVNSHGMGKPDLVLGNGKTHHCHYISPGPVGTSDHIPIVMEVSCDPIKVPAPERFMYKDAKWPEYTAEIDSKTSLDHTSRPQRQDPQ